MVSSTQTDEARIVIERVAGERGAPLFEVGRDIAFEEISHTLQGQSFRVWSNDQDGIMPAERATG